MVKMATSTEVIKESLIGKVALVSGSSAGIGAAIAKELSRRGASVIINYPFLSEEPAARRVLESLGGNSRSIIVEADLTTLEGPKKLAATVADKFGHIDILVNNAGLVFFAISPRLLTWRSIRPGRGLPI